MNVTLLTTTLGWGGTERYVVDLAEALHRDGVQTRVVADEPPTDRVSRLHSAGVETIVLGRQYLSSRELYIGRLVEVLQSCRPDVVHLNGWQRSTWTAAAASKLKLRAFRTEHNTQRPIRVRDVLGLNRQPFSWYRQVLQSLKFRIPAICISDRSLENLRRRTLGLIESVRIYNGINATANFPRAPKGRRMRVVWVGSMTERKRPLLAIEAIERAAASRHGISLVMVGDGPLLQDARRRAKSVRFADIEFRGNTFNVMEEMALSDVFVQTSSDEGISFAVLEAMSLGLPVVATDVGATAEAVLDCDTGYLIGAEQTASRIARRVAFLLDHPNAARSMGNSGFERCRTVFSLTRMLRETRQLYSETTATALRASAH